MVQETELSAPVKAYLEKMGYEVKAEIGAADLVGLREGEDPVIVELKTRFSLALFHQGIARLSVSDCVYIAVPRGAGKPWQRAIRENVKLARRLGLGLLTVRLRDGFVEAHCDPGLYAPRKSKPKQARLLKEFAKRQGDPNLGGTRGAVVTAYRQDAITCAQHLLQNGPCKGAAVKTETGVERATTIMRDNHYGWFEKVDKGVYSLTEAGRLGLQNLSDPLKA